MTPQIGTNKYSCEIKVLIFVETPTWYKWDKICEDGGNKLSFS